jgi:subtilisin family serine protease
MRRLLACLALTVCSSLARADQPAPADCPMDGSPLIWSLYEIQAFDTGYDGTGVTVAVIDCGFPRNYDDYLPPGSVDTTYAAGFGPLGWGSTSSDQRTSDFYGVNNFHAIVVASAIVGFRTSPYTLATFGVGPCTPGVAVGAKILPIRAYPRNSFEFATYAPDAWIAAAFRYLAELKGGGAFPGGLIANASFGIDGITDDPQVRAAIDEAIAAGVIVVASAGNEGPGEGTVGFPANMPEVIAVGGAGLRGEKAFAEDPLWFLSYEEPPVFPAYDPPVYIAGFSSRGSEVDLVAPAAWVAWAGFDHRGEAGGPLDRTPALGMGATSFAAPTVAGVVALMLEKNPTLVQAEVDCILKRSALPITDAPAGVWTSLADEMDATLNGLGWPGDALYETHVGPPCPTDAPCSIVPPWGASASGAGLVQARAALALTPFPGEPVPGCAADQVR